jgi:hypothetical protein
MIEKKQKCCTPACAIQPGTGPWKQRTGDLYHPPATSATVTCTTRELVHASTSLLGRNGDGDSVA